MMTLLVLRGWDLHFTGIIEGWWCSLLLLHFNTTDLTQRLWLGSALPGQGPCEVRGGGLGAHGVRGPTPPPSCSQAAQSLVTALGEGGEFYEPPGLFV